VSLSLSPRWGTCSTSVRVARLDEFRSSKTPTWSVLDSDWDSLHFYVRVDLEVEVQKAIAQRRPLEGIFRRRAEECELQNTSERCPKQRHSGKESGRSELVVEDVLAQVDSGKSDGHEWLPRFERRRHRPRIVRLHIKVRAWTQRFRRVSLQLPSDISVWAEFSPARFSTAIKSFI